MKIVSHPHPLLYRYLIGGAGFVLLIVSSLHAPSTHWAAWILTVFIAFLVNIPLNSLASEINLSPILILEAGLLFGPTMTGWAAAVGILAGYLIRRGRQGDFQPGRLLRKVGKARANPIEPKTWLAEMGYLMGMALIPLVISLEASQALQSIGNSAYPVEWMQGIASLPKSNSNSIPIWTGMLLPVSLFAVVQLAVFLGDARLQQSSRNATRTDEFTKDLRTFLVVTLAPSPFIIFSASVYPVNQIGQLFTLSILPTILAFLLHNILKNQTTLERRLQELSTLNNISRALRSTLVLESLLAVIHQQVTQLLGVDSFYVALYDTNHEGLWYPLAVKYGQRQNWAPRSLMPDRLTDRVIQLGKPINVTPSNREELALAGVPMIDDVMAWAGVPLITSEQTIGCLAAFGFIPGKEFAPADITLLTTLSGQASVAIQNALLFEQLQRRAAQLENLNHIMSLITASLETDQVLAQVCRAAAELANGQRSAIYLLEQNEERALLAYAHGFSETFIRQSNESAMFQGGRARALRTGHAALTTDLRTTTLERSLAAALRQEGIQAIGDFPLTTPDGSIGILSVYFNAPHTFGSDEVDLLQTLASQAAISVANARLYATTDKALARRADQLAILEAVGRELSAAISSPSLFEVIVSHALQFTGSPWGMLTFYQPLTRQLEIKASRGYPTRITQLSLDDGLVGDAIRLKEAINVKNTQKVNGCLDLTEGASRAQLYVPLVHEERVLGVLILESAEEDAYQESDQAFIVQLATQAAVAVVNAELYGEAQRRLREQSILYGISTRLVGNLELEGILKTVADTVGAVVPNAAVGVYMWEDANGCYTARQYANTTRPDCHMPETVQDRELSKVRPALFKTGPLQLPSDKVDTGALTAGCKNCRPLVLPLVVKQQRQGMILLHLDKNQEISDEASQLLHTIGAQVSLAMQNALLFHDVSQGRDQMAAVLNSVGEAIVMLTNEGRILLANRAVESLTGIALEKLIGLYLVELPVRGMQTLGYTYAEAETLVKTLEQAQSQPFPKTIFNISDNSPEKVLERSIVPVWGGNSRAAGWLIVLRDITEENQVAEARELITQTLVHDLRAPISSVLGAVDILDDSFSLEPRDELTDQALRVARNGSQRVLTLVETLMDIARLKSGKIDLNLVWLDLHHLSENVTGELLPPAQVAGVHLRNEIPADLPKIRADAVKLGRVLTNLLDNALKFTPENGEVVIGAEMNLNGILAIQVSDTGPGVPEEFREKIFDRFSQVPGQQGRRRGSGLGLTFCKLAVEAHGGRIWVEPHPGGGSIFTLTLPIDGPSNVR